MVWSAQTAWHVDRITIEMLFVVLYVVRIKRRSMRIECEAHDSTSCAAQREIDNA